MTTSPPPAIRELPYEQPVEGQNYWLLDNVLVDPDAVRQRCLAKTDWLIGFPRKPESWPGMRAIPALTPEELDHIETWVKQVTKVEKLWVESAPGGARLNHNCVQLVGAREAQARPHTDSRSLCRYAGVLYLNPGVPEQCGTSFYRQRMAGGKPGGNVVADPYHNLVEALGSRFVPQGSFVEDVRVPHRFNRLLLYRANLIHSATAYWGTEPMDRRMAAVFFWMA